MDIVNIIRTLEANLEEVERQLADTRCACDNGQLRRRQVNLLHELLFLYSGNPKHSAAQRLTQAALASHSNSKPWGYYDDY
jgi:hypothetical protein